MATHFEYRRSSRSEAIWTALWGGSLLALVSVLIFVTAVYRDRTGGQVLTLIVAIAGTMFGLALCYYVIANCLVNQDFVFRIDDSGIEQIVPIRGGGESFQIPAKQLHYAISVFSDGSRDLTLFNCDGERFEVTVNFGNPLNQIVATLKELNIPVLMEAPADLTPTTPAGTKTS